MGTNIAADYAAAIADVDLRLVAPDLTTEYVITPDAREIRLTRGPLLQDVLTIKAAIQSLVCTAANSTSTAIRDEWEDWALVLTVRGAKKFDGPVVAGGVVWTGNFAPGQTIEYPGSYVELVAETWFTHECRRRYVATADGSQYSNTDSPNRVFCDLIRTSMVTGAVATPTGWQQGSETRDDQGAVTVACAAPSAAGDSIAYKQDVGHHLLDALLELCNMPSADADKLWPSQSRSGATVTLGCLRGRSGAGRGIGTDHTEDSGDPVVVAAERGNLRGYKFSFDRTQKENHLSITGAGRSTNQRRRYATNAGDVAAHGICEGWENLPQAHTDAELDLEGARLLYERMRGLRNHEWTAMEAPGFQWPTDFDIADSLTCVVPTGQKNASATVDPVLVETNVIGLEWSLVAPGPAEIKLTLGMWPPTPERDLGRSGGGGRGGRGGGGRPRQKHGESEADPDTFKSYAYLLTESGDNAAEGINHYAQFAGKDRATSYVRTKVYGTNSGSSGEAGHPDMVEDEIIATFSATTNDPDGHITIRLDDGNSAEINCKRVVAPP